MPRDRSLVVRVVARVRAGVGPLALTLIVLSLLQPLLGFLDHNKGQYLPMMPLVVVGLAMLGVAVVGYLILLLVVRRAEPVRVALVVALFVVCFFSYGGLFDDDGASPWRNLLLWAALTGLVVAAVGLWSRREEVRLFGVLFLAVLTLQSAVSYAVFNPPAAPVQRSSAASARPIEVTDDAVRTPDVWWMLLDEYSRQDTLQELFDFDNGPFLDDLTANGFVVSDESYTSYPATPLALASVLDMDYIDLEAGHLRASFPDATASLRGGGRVVDALAHHGYRQLYADNGVFDFAKCDPALADECLDRTGRLFPGGEVARTLLDRTPLREIRSEVPPDSGRMVREAQATMDPDGSEFVFAHVLNPHWPYWSDDGCNYRSMPVGGEFDGDRYLHELRCLNQRVLDAVDAITEADPEAIVIIQSDHGSRLLSSATMKYEDWTPAALAERYGILEAMRFPTGCQTPQGVHTNVATFEYVLACIEGRPAQPIEDRYFFWRFDPGTEAFEIPPPPPIDAEGSPARPPARQPG